MALGRIKAPVSPLFASDPVLSGNVDDLPSISELRYGIAVPDLHNRVEIAEKHRKPYALYAFEQSRFPGSLTLSDTAEETGKATVNLGPDVIPMPKPKAYEGPEIEISPPETDIAVATKKPEVEVEQEEKTDTDLPWYLPLKLKMLDAKAAIDAFMWRHPRIQSALTFLMSDTFVRGFTIATSALAIGVVAAIGGSIPLAAIGLGLIVGATAFGIVRSVMKTHELRTLRNKEKAELDKDHKSRVKSKDSHERQVDRLKKGIIDEKKESEIGDTLRGELTEDVTVHGKSTARSLFMTYVDYGLESIITFPLKVITGSIGGMVLSLLSFASVALGTFNRQKFEQRRDELKDNIAALRTQRAERQATYRFLVARLGKEEAIERLVEVKKELRSERIIEQPSKLDLYATRYNMTPEEHKLIKDFQHKRIGTTEIPQNVRDTVSTIVNRMESDIRKEATSRIERAQDTGDFKASDIRAEHKPPSVSKSIQKYVRGDTIGEIIEPSLKKGKKEAKEEQKTKWEEKVRHDPHPPERGA